MMQQQKEWEKTHRNPFIWFKAHVQAQSDWVVQNVTGKNLHFWFFSGLYLSSRCLAWILSLVEKLKFTVGNPECIVLDYTLLKHFKNICSSPLETSLSVAFLLLPRTCLWSIFPAKDMRSWKGIWRKRRLCIRRIPRSFFRLDQTRLESFSCRWHAMII